MADFRRACLDVRSEAVRPVSSPLDYADYLCLDSLLACQNPLSKEHDELLFLVIHQASELWMKLCLHELSAARSAISRGELPIALKMLSRVARIQSQLIQSWDILATMTPADYVSFRSVLGTSSGLQSAQYRRMEFILGARNEAMLAIHAGRPEVYRVLLDEMRRPSLYDEVLQLLVRRGFDTIEARTDDDLSLPRSTSPHIEAAWATVYRNPDSYWDLYDLGEKLVDLDFRFQQWRFAHLKAVERVIGFKVGTGGTSGAAYLQAKAIGQSFFPELLSVRNLM